MDPGSLGVKTHWENKTPKMYASEFIGLWKQSILKSSAPGIVGPGDIGYTQDIGLWGTEGSLKCRGLGTLDPRNKIGLGM